MKTSPGIVCADGLMMIRPSYWASVVDYRSEVELNKDGTAVSKVRGAYICLAAGACVLVDNDQRQVFYIFMKMLKYFNNHLFLIPAGRGTQTRPRVWAVSHIFW